MKLFYASSVLQFVFRTLGVFAAAVGVCHAQSQIATNAPVSSSSDGYAVVGRGLDYRIWQGYTYQTNAAGIVITNSQRYTELATGMSYMKDGQLLDSVEEIDPVAGGFQAVQGRHNVQWTANANTPTGAVTLTMPDNSQLVSVVYGLAYLDRSSGSNVLIAPLQDSTGSLVATNELVYPNAFQGVSADLDYVYTIGGLAQNVLIRDLPSPASYGLIPESTVLQVITEFLAGPEPEKATVNRNGENFDDVVNFSAMQISVGKAFLVQGTNGAQSVGVVDKHWVQTNQVDFLLEEIPYSVVSNMVPAHASNAKPGYGPVWRTASIGEPKHKEIVQATVKKTAPAPRPRGDKAALAAYRQPNDRYLRLDYDIVNTTSNYTFQGDSTYYVSNNVILIGTINFEGGAVIKYNSNGPSISISYATGTQINWLAGDYLPVMFTAKDYDYIGAEIGNSTHTPVGYYANPALSFTLISPAMSHFNIQFAQQAIATLDADITITDGQIVNSSNGISGYSGIVDLQNLLFANVPTALNNVASSGNLTWEIFNTTFGGDTNGAAVLLRCATSVNNNLLLTNCILANLSQFLVGGTTGTNIGYNGFYGNGPAAYGFHPTTVTTQPFQIVGAGGYYLSNSCPFTTAGTSAIPPTLLADLQVKTVFPPDNTNLWGVTKTTSYTCQPGVPRDTGPSTSLGYHYDALDYALNLTLEEATLTILPGTALAMAGPAFGISLQAPATIICEGNATNLTHITRYTTVQEQSNPTWEGWWTAFISPTSGTASSVSLRFTELTEINSENFFYGNSGSDFPVILRDCQVYNGAFYSYGPTFSVTNCLFKRPVLMLSDQYGDVENHQFYNDLFIAGQVTTDHQGSGTWNFNDNLFDQSVISYTYTAASEANNAYVTNNGSFTNFSMLTPTKGVHDAILTNSPSYQVGTLGVNYYPTTQTNLINQGSRLASTAGLYHYTVLTDNAIEGSNTVSIGFHYVATDSDGNPLDTSGTGVPDYILDANGDGIYDVGDFGDWQNPFNIYDQGMNFSGYTPSNVRLSYWKFDSTAFTNQAGAGTISNYNMLTSTSFSGTAAQFTSSDCILVYGQTNFSCSNGTVRFWFQPNWSTGGMAASNGDFIQIGGGTQSYGSAGEGWGLSIGDYGSILELNTRDQSHISTGGNLLSGSATQINFSSGLWYQIALTYSPTNIAVYANGALLTTASGTYELLTGGTNSAPIFGAHGVLYYPTDPDPVNPGLAVGNNFNFLSPVDGQIDELETFNYPLTAQQIAAGFPTFGGTNGITTDTRYVGVSDMLQTLVYGTSNPQVRLGYWRFDSPLLYGEQGQMPLWATSVNLSNSWSGTALSVANTTKSGVAYPDVYTNGWANINCRNGTVRLWLKPNWGSGGAPSVAPLVYLGNATNATDGEWSFQIASGSTLELVTASNSSPGPIVSTSCTLNSNNWTQLVLTYGSNGCALYINGAFATTNHTAPVWPTVADRSNGMVIGNNTFSNSPANAQFDEIETFNYQLSPTQISNNFQAVTAYDTNLDGVPDVLEDMQYSTTLPYLGAPVTVTGTIKAEQFDQGGNGTSYSSLAGNTNTTYRNSGMIITNCYDTNSFSTSAVGYCVVGRASEWANYSISNLVSQQYTIDTRVAGTGVGGVFEFIFYMGGVPYLTNVAPAITTTNWTDISCVTTGNLSPGNNVMRLVFLTNGVGSTDVGLFNYISVYPYLAPPTVGPGSYNLSGQLTANASDWASASTNAAKIEAAISSISTSGGTIYLPAGTFYVSEPAPNENNNIYQNTAVPIEGNKIRITGAGPSPTDTTLVAFDRTTTIFTLNGGITTLTGSNFMLDTLTLVAQPHEIAVPTNTGGFTTNFEAGSFQDGNTSSNYHNQGDGVVCWLCGLKNTNITYYDNGILVTNCIFVNADRAIAADFVTNLAVRGCTFIALDTNNPYSFLTNVYSDVLTMNLPNYASNTVAASKLPSVVTVFASSAYNLVLADNYFNGNTAITSIVPTNRQAPDGFLWGQASGNVFVGRNTMINHYFEAVQLNAGPNAVTGNTFTNGIIWPFTCALRNTEAIADPGVNGSTGGFLSTFVGNWSCGEYFGVLSPVDTSQYTNVLPNLINISGNYISFPGFGTNVYPGTNGAPTAGAEIETCATINMCGNTLASGGYGLFFTDGCTNALVLNNNFAGAVFGGIGCGIANTSPTMASARVINNTLADGVTFHVQLPPQLTNSFGWFLYGNQYLNSASNVVAPFLDPASSAVHISN